MFIQHLNLDPATSYETTASAENVAENLLLDYTHVPIITLYSSKGESEESIRQKLKEPKHAISLTVAQYKSFKNDFDSTHIILPEFYLLESFGYSLDDFNKPLIVEEGNKFAKLPLCRFFIKAERDERFVAIYLIAQLFHATIVTKNPNRAKIFCNIFELNCEVIGYDELGSRIETECCIFIDGYQSIECERIFIIDHKPFKYERLFLDLSEAGKYKYRICDVMRRISLSAAKNIKTFDYSPFKNINK